MYYFVTKIRIDSVLWQCQSILMMTSLAQRFMLRALHEEVLDSIPWNNWEMNCSKLILKSTFWDHFQIVFCCSGTHNTGNFLV